MDREEFTDYEGMDPGLKESIYDGAEYELDEFGERIGAEDTAEEAMSEDEVLSEDEMRPLSAVEDGFGEAITPASNPHLEDQLDDSKLHDEAEAENPSPDKPAEP